MNLHILRVLEGTFSFDVAHMIVVVLPLLCVYKVQSLPGA